MAAMLWPVGATWAAESSQITVGTNRKIESTLYKPAGAGPFPAVLVLHTSGGLQAADLAYAAKLADEGYVCMVPDFFKAYGLHPNTRQQTFTAYAAPIYEDFVNAIDVLKKMPGVRGDATGAVGFSNGGYWAMLLAARKHVQAGVSYYGAFNGAGSDNTLEAMRSSFNENSSPVLVLHGVSDTTVNIRFAEMLASILRNAKVPNEVQLYQATGHSYDRSGGNAEATADSWTRTLDFFGRTLKKTAAQ
jgi:carboxymethylenebutenolidase